MDPATGAFLARSRAGGQRAAACRAARGAGARRGTAARWSRRASRGFRRSRRVTRRRCRSFVAVAACARGGTGAPDAQPDPTTIATPRRWSCAHRVRRGASAAAERSHARLPGRHRLGGVGERAHDVRWRDVRAGRDRRRGRRALVRTATTPIARERRCRRCRRYRRCWRCRRCRRYRLSARRAGSGSRRDRRPSSDLPSHLRARRR